MPKTKRSHQDNFKRVCAVCWQKCLRTARSMEVPLIQEYVISNYTTFNAHFPSALCQTCSPTLIEYRTGNFKRTLKISNDFSPGVLPATRTNSDCPYRICKIAKENAITQSQDKPRNVSETTPVQPGNFKVCSECFATIYKGNIL